MGLTLSKAIITQEKSKINQNDKIFNKEFDRWLKIVEKNFRI